MKYNQNHGNGRSLENDRCAAPQFVPVHFEVTHPTAFTVEVAGTFKDWLSETKARYPFGNGRLLKETVLPPSK
jgi:hypothetical protein